MLAERLCKNDKELSQAVKYCISNKTIHGKKYVYKQWTEDHKRNQEGVPAWEVADVLAKYEEKKKLKAERREINAQIAAMTRAERKQFWEEVELCRTIEELDEKCEKSQMPNGDARDSADELAISLMMDMLEVEYQYNKAIWTGPTIRRADFIVNGIVWEHMGMKGVAEYDRRQERKMQEYRDIGLIQNMNLITTERAHDPATGRSYLKLPRILWHMVKYGLVSARTVRRVFRL